MKTFLAGITAVFAIAVGSVQAATISLSPVSQTGVAGSPITLDLDISGLGSGTALSAFDISVNFDSAALSLQSVTFGDPALGDQLDLGHLGLNGPTATSGTGTLDLIETDIFDSPSTLLSNQTHNFTLGALSFHALTAGTTPITLTVNSLANQSGNPFSVSTQNASVAIAPVPLPTAGILLMSGLGAVGASLTRRRKPVGKACN